MQFEEFSSHQEEKDEKTVGHQTYRLFTEEGRLTGICVTGELRGKIYRREDEGIDKKIYRKAVNTLARENPSELIRFMNEIKEDKKYAKIARKEISKVLKSMETLRSAIAC